MVTDTPASVLDRVRQNVQEVTDPEIPVLTIADLGVLRSVELIDSEVVVTITPTYSGCPAMAHIESQVRQAIKLAGASGRVVTVFSPPWSTDFITVAGREKLEAYGIAPPHPAAHGSAGTGSTVHIRPAIRCPQCGSTNTKIISEFGSTACKALYQCQACAEPFDYFKEL